MEISIKLLSDRAILPVYQTAGSAGADVHACLEAPLMLMPGDRKVVPTGFALMIPEGYEAQIRARSGLSLKHGITMANGIGTIDADYRGEVGVILVNISDKPFKVEHGMRVAQMIVSKCERAIWRPVKTLSSSARDEGGYGSTGS